MLSIAYQGDRLAGNRALTTVIFESCLRMVLMTLLGAITVILLPSFSYFTAISIAVHALLGASH